MRPSRMRPFCLPNFLLPRSGVSLRSLNRILNGGGFVRSFRFDLVRLAAAARGDQARDAEALAHAIEVETGHAKFAKASMGGVPIDSGRNRFVAVTRSRRRHRDRRRHRHRHGGGHRCPGRPGHAQLFRTGHDQGGRLRSNASKRGLLPVVLCRQRGAVEPGGGGTQSLRSGWHARLARRQASRIVSLSRNRRDHRRQLRSLRSASTRSHRGERRILLPSPRLGGLAGPLRRSNRLLSELLLRSELGEDRRTADHGARRGASGRASAGAGSSRRN